LYLVEAQACLEGGSADINGRSALGRLAGQFQPNIGYFLNPVGQYVGSANVAQLEPGTRAFSPLIPHPHGGCALLFARLLHDDYRNGLSIPDDIDCAGSRRSNQKQQPNHGEYQRNYTGLSGTTVRWFNCDHSFDGLWPHGSLAGMVSLPAQAPAGLSNHFLTASITLR
jgi:hypothetical protein